MPVVTVDWWKGNGRSQRAELVSELTSSVSRIAGCPKEAVTVIVRDVEQGYWGKGGTLADTEAPVPEMEGVSDADGGLAAGPVSGEANPGRWL